MNTFPEQYFGVKISEKRNKKLNTVPQEAKVYIFTDTCQREKYIICKYIWKLAFWRLPPLMSPHNDKNIWTQ